MKVYFFDEKTKEFLAEREANKDIMASQRQGQDVWLLPANATFTKPLEAKDGFCVVYTEDEWQYVEDYRQHKAVNGHGIFLIDYIGKIKVGDILISDEQEKLIKNGDLAYNNGQLNEKSQERKQFDKRLERNSLLKSTDKYMLSDYPITEEERELYRRYRQYLRDFPKSDGFEYSEIKTFVSWKGA